MKSPVAAGVALALVLFASPSFATKTNLKAALEGSQSVPPSLKTGTGNFTYDDVTKKLCGKVTFDTLESAPTGVVLKNATTNALVKTLTPAPSPMSVNATMTATEGAFILDPGVYIAIQTTGHPSPGDGEINGILEVDGVGVEQVCPGSGTDAGVVDSGTSSTSSSSGTSGTSGDTTSGGDTDAGDTSGDDSSGDDSSGTTKKPAAKKDSGCSTSGSASGGSIALAALVGLGLLSRSRSRRR